MEPEPNFDQQLAFGSLRRASDAILISQILAAQKEMRNDIKSLNQRVNILFGALGVITVLANAAVGFVVTQVLK